MRRFLHFSLFMILLGVCASCAKSSWQWEADLRSRDPFVRGMAALGMGLRDPGSAQPALPVLLATIDRSDVGLEAQAAQVLSVVGPYHVQFLLEQLVSDPLMSIDRRNAIKNALVGAGALAVDAIAACLSGPGMQLAGDLGDVLLAIGMPALPAMVRMLEQAPDPRLRNFAAYLLGNLGPRARSALPALQAATSAENEGLRAAALEAIRLIEGRAPRAARAGQ